MSSKQTSTAPRKSNLKWTSAALIAALFATAVPRVAAAAPRETVYLKGGGLINGELVELLPGKYVSVQIAGNQVREVPWPDVDRVVRDDDAPHAKPKPARTATLVVDSTKPDTRIGRVTQRMTATASGDGGTATATGVSWVDLCQAPCKVQLPPGLVELKLGGPGYPTTYKHFNLRPGINHVVAKPGSSALYGTGLALFILGAITTTAAGSLWGVGAAFHDKIGAEFARAAMPVTLVGAGATALGVGLWVAGSSSMKRGHDPVRDHHAHLVGVRGTF